METMPFKRIKKEDGDIDIKTEPMHPGPEEADDLEEDKTEEDFEESKSVWKNPKDEKKDKIKKSKKSFGKSFEVIPEQNN